MRSTTRAVLAGVLAIAGLAVGGPPSARAQMGMSAAGRSLGGYGAGTISSYYGGGGGSSMLYNGNASGFAPYQGGTGGMGVQSPARSFAPTTIGGAMMPATPIGGASAAGGMTGGGRGGPGMGMGTRTGRRAYAPLLPGGGMGIGGGMPGMAGQGGSRRSPPGPGFGYPFQMPASLPGDASTGMP